MPLFKIETGLKKEYIDIINIQNQPFQILSLRMKQTHRVIGWLGELVHEFSLSPSFMGGSNEGRALQAISYLNGMHAHWGWKHRLSNRVAFAGHSRGGEAATLRA